MRENSRERVSYSLGQGRNSYPNSFNYSNKKDFRDGLVSIFIGNINPIVDSLGLWKTFKIFEKVRDVFLSAKRNSNGSCFAFIRFGTLEEAEKVAQKVNGMHVYGWPIEAKLETYDWNIRRSIARSPNDRDKFRNGHSRAGGLERIQHSRSYAEAVKVDKDFFTKLGSKVGKLLWCPETTGSNGRMDVGRLLICAPLDKQICCDVEVKAGNCSFSVRMEETTTPVSDSWIINRLGLRPMTEKLNSEQGRDRADVPLPKACWEWYQDEGRGHDIGRVGRCKDDLKADRNFSHSNPKVLRRETEEGRGALGKGKGLWIQKLRIEPKHPRCNDSLRIRHERRMESMGETDTCSSDTEVRKRPPWFQNKYKMESSKAGRSRKVMSSGPMENFGNEPQDFGLTGENESSPKNKMRELMLIDQSMGVSRGVRPLGQEGHSMIQSSMEKR
ncbi:hypothetical protein Dsin_000641 [Dipteronia sinensis]|uniref:RRM domain-containing protein n=1 Tax=Dipteronia sinensis TaxID=43782 RepID=A0AAE0EJK3_9ROSI|nr:hypothetical protein Dsin_000641 [Dipteronia sinensis]